MIVSPDSYLITESGEYVWTPERVKAAWNQSYAALKRLSDDPRYEKVVLMVGIPASGKSTWLKRNHDPSAIYFDAPFTTQRARLPVIQIAKEAGMVVEAAVMTTPIAVCKDRNSCRSVDRKVPDEVVERMAAQLLGDPPKVTEGFDRVYAAR